MCKSWILISLFLGCVNVFAQAYSTSNNSNLEQFPEIQIITSLRDPDIKDSHFFKVIEQGNESAFTVSHLGAIEHTNGKHLVLILVENLSQTNRFDFYQNALKGGLNLDPLDNIEIAIATFDRVRKQGTQSLQEVSSFTNQTNEILTSVSQITPEDDIFSKNQSSDLYLSIYEGLQFLGNREAASKSMILLSSGFNNKWSSHTSSESTKALALKKNIAIYSLQYRIQGYEHHRLSDVVDANHGKELITNNPEAGATFISETLQNIPVRQGHRYGILYRSQLPDDGKQYQIDLLLDKEVTKITIQTPNGYLKYYYVLIICGSLLLIGGFFFLIRHHNKKNKKALIALEQKNKEREQKTITTQSTLQSEIKTQQHQLTAIYKEKEESLAREKRVASHQILFEAFTESGLHPLLEYKNNEDVMLSVMIKTPTFIIGRAPECHLTINDPSISRRHASIDFKDGVFIIKDLNSSAGTKINDDTIHHEILQHGNIIQMGTTEITFIL